MKETKSITIGAVERERERERESYNLENIEKAFKNASLVMHIREV